MAVFSDSQLRSLVEGTVVPPSNWYVNCNPGGMFADMAYEMQAAAVSKSTPPKFVVFLVSTNNMSGRCTMERATSKFKIFCIQRGTSFQHLRYVYLRLICRLQYGRTVGGVLIYILFVSMHTTYVKKLY